MEYADGMSLYQYCRSAPVMFPDPEGLAAPGEFLDMKDITLQSTDEWKRISGNSYGKQAGFTQVESVAEVTSEYNPSSPCDCTLTINRLDAWAISYVPGAGVVWREKSWWGTQEAVMTQWLSELCGIHERWHRIMAKAVWKKYKDQLTETRPCSYTRGWIFVAPDVQSEEKCREHAGKLAGYLNDTHGKHQEAVQKVFDAGARLWAGIPTMKDAYGAAIKELNGLQMRDWDCKDTR
jgi:hypothetical protein